MIEMKKAKTKKFKIRCSFSKLSPCVFPYCEGCGFKMCYEQGKREAKAGEIWTAWHVNILRERVKETRIATYEEVIKEWRKVILGDKDNSTWRRACFNYRDWLEQHLKEAKGE